MSPIKIVKDTEVEYRFITNYYDVPLRGSCYYLGKLYSFSRKDEGNYLYLFHLNMNGERRWKWKQFWFEQCVGYHWSWFPKNRHNKFYYRNPQWLYKFLFWLYYKLKKNAR
jgi:hypothetical protein